MKVKFTKMHGAGNDFVVIDDRDGKVPEDFRRIAAMAAHRTGIGCEGVILVQKIRCYSSLLCDASLFRRSRTSDFCGCSFSYFND